MKIDFLIYAECFFSLALNSQKFHERFNGDPLWKEIRIQITLRCTESKTVMAQVEFQVVNLQNPM